MKTKQNPQNVGTAVIGLGRGKSHVKSYAAAKNCELLAVCDINADLAKAVAEQYGVDAYTDYKELLKRDDIQLISVVTPSGMHCDMAAEIAAAGKHVLAEKPLDITLGKIDMGVKAFEDAGLQLGCIFQNRLAPANQKMKETIDSGRLGKLVVGTAHVKWYRTQEYYEQNGGWRGTWALDGGGSLMNQSVHTIDLLQWMMGPVKSVVGASGIFAHDIETEDLGVALVKFQSGALATIVGTTSAYPGFGTSLEINGLNGGIFMKDNHITAWKIKGENMEAEEAEILSQYGPKEKKVKSGASDPNAIEGDTTFQQVQDMIYAVRDNRPPMISGKEGRKAVEIILAIYESARTGKEVFLPL